MAVKKELDGDVITLIKLHYDQFSAIRRHAQTTALGAFTQVLPNACVYPEN